MKTITVYGFLGICIAVGTVLGLGVDSRFVDKTLLQLLTVLTGSISYFSIVGEAQRVVPENELKNLEPRVASALEDVVAAAQSFRDAMYTQFKRSSISPPTFDQDIALYESLRAPSEGILNAAKAIRSGQSCDPVGDAVDKVAENNSDRWVFVLLNRIKDEIKAYDRARADVARRTARAERSPLETFLKVAGPYTAALTIGLAIFQAFAVP